MSRFTLLQAQKKFGENANNFPPAVRSRLFTDFSACITLAHANSLLLQHGIYSFYSYMSLWVTDAQRTLADASARLPKAHSEILHNPDLTSLLYDLEKQVAREDFCSHPKLDRLTKIVVEHFVDHESGMRERGESEEGGEGAQETRVMIFSSFRESVDEIKRVLDMKSPRVRPMAFVGQANSKGGSKGLSQKQQQQVMVFDFNGRRLGLAFILGFFFLIFFFPFFQ